LTPVVSTIAFSDPVGVALVFVVVEDAGVDFAFVAAGEAFCGDDPKDEELDSCCGFFPLSRSVFPCVV
jgi:hypothetical protein